MVDECEKFMTKIENDKQGRDDMEMSGVDDDFDSNDGDEEEEVTMHVDEVSEMPQVVILEDGED